MESVSVKIEYTQKFDIEQILNGFCPHLKKAQTSVNEHKKIPAE